MFRSSIVVGTILLCLGLGISRAFADDQLPQGSRRSDQIGGQGGRPFVNANRGTLPVIGFQITEADWFGRPCVRHVEPLYEMPDDLHPQGSTICLPKDGYVIKGIVLTDQKDGLHGMRVVFARKTATGFDASDTYMSQWFGDSKGTSHALMAVNERVIGVFGRQGLNQDALGLVFIPMKLAATQNSVAANAHTTAGVPTTQASSVLDQLVGSFNHPVVKNADGVVVEGFGSQVQTSVEYAVPLVIKVRAKTSDDNIRVVYGQRGLLIFNWEMNRSEFRFHDPTGGMPVGVPGKGSVPANTWVSIQWTITEHESRISVDGVERASFKGNYAGLQGAVGMTTNGSSVVTISSLEVAGAVATGPSQGAGRMRRIHAPGPVVTTPPPPAANVVVVTPTTKPASILGELTADTGSNIEKSAEGITLQKGNTGQAMAWSASEFGTPLALTIRAKVDQNDLRIFYGGQGQLVFNLPSKEHWLIYDSPGVQSHNMVGGNGTLPSNTWVTIQWIIDNDRVSINVDGMERGMWQGDYRGLHGKFGVGTAFGPNVQISSMEVSQASSVARGSPYKPPVTPPAVVSTIRPPSSPRSRIRPDQPAAQGPISIDVNVPITPPAPPEGFNAAAAASSESIERPEFQYKAKPLLKNVTSVTAMMVRLREDGEMMGLTSDIIATVNAESRRGSTAGAGFYRADGDETMKTAFQEAVRAVTMRYPFWQPGHVDISFGEKFVPHGGPSAGTAFGLLLLSSLEGFEIDPKCAVTGDISVDWKVRKVGGVSAKLRGAALDHCLYAAIPRENEQAVPDMALLFGNASVYNIQVFSIATLQDATAIARKDRSPQLTEAIKLFADLQTRFASSELGTLKDPQTAAALKHIIELAPNHLSARQLLALCENTAPKTLSSSAALYQVAVVIAPYMFLLEEKQKIDRESLPAYLPTASHKRLASLRSLASDELKPLLDDVDGVVSAMDDLAAKGGSRDNVTERVQRFRERAGSIVNDPEFMEKLMRDGN